MIYAFYGVMGSGKSLSATALALQFADMGYNIHSNYAIYESRDSNDLISEWRDIPSEQLKMGDWTPSERSIILLDEFDRYVDPRRSMSGGNISIDRLIRHCRKLKTHLIITLHFRRLLDLRVDYLITGGWGVEVDCSFYDSDKHDIDRDVVKWIVTDFTKETPKRGRYYLNAEKYYDYYDTDELIIGFSA